MGIIHFIGNVLLNIYIFSWDTVLTLFNLILPNKAVGKITPKGHPGFGGKWPEYVRRKDGDSRCSCPALNAMANHGILPHDGRNIKFTEMSQKIRTTYNFSSTFCLFVPNYAAGYLKKSYRKDTFDLQDLDLHNAIEHDGSLVREDFYNCPDQSIIAVPLVEQLVACASGKDADGKPLLTAKDLSQALTQRRVDAKATNPNHFSTSLVHRTFGSANASTLLTIFGGRMDDIRSLLFDERLPDRWESRVRSQFGLTFGAFNSTVIKVQFGVKNPPSKGQPEQA
ncbi:hypothetical protein PILCRDRAFT_825071 [Piloderma croceum F 1598]|uniref:Heme haloperoxidase family profile domain-containing protein n=1 Tax=Piloderma croceum (strain F 1598) TaxID=765440 RepID=A0A0C3FDB1_PILCF|nr:hypothetical protein PILCRDRAFT_825071 [Piloderma croceum F 1598]